MKLANNIKEVRKRLRITQEQLAEKLHVSQGTVANWESGKRTPDVGTIALIAAVLHVSISELIGEQKSAPAESSESTKSVDIIDEPELIELLAESHTETELRKVVNNLSRDNKLKLIEYARLLLLSQYQADREDPE